MTLVPISPRSYLTESKLVSSFTCSARDERNPAQWKDTSRAAPAERLTRTDITSHFKWDDTGQLSLDSPLDLRLESPPDTPRLLPAESTWTRSHLQSNSTPVWPICSHFRFVIMRWQCRHFAEIKMDCNNLVSSVPWTADLTGAFSGG